MTVWNESIQATILPLDSTAPLVPTLFWPESLSFQAPYGASGSINMACISTLDSFLGFRQTYSLFWLHSNPQPCTSDTPAKRFPLLQEIHTHPYVHVCWLVRGEFTVMVRINGGRRDNSQLFPERHGRRLRFNAGRPPTTFTASAPPARQDRGSLEALAIAKTTGAGD